MNENLEKLFKLTRGKEVFLATHYDADGVVSGALMFHLLKDVAKKINTISKGLVFSIEPEDITGNPDVIICTDIKPSSKLDLKKVIYIDHHPMALPGEGPQLSDFLWYLFDEHIQSCSMVIWQDLMQGTIFGNNPYMIFLTLLGYFGDGGKPENIPIELQVLADDLLKLPTKRGTHDLMEVRQSKFDEGTYLEIQRYVSALNTGKRMHWHGTVPLELLKNIDEIKYFIYNIHPIAQQLQEFRRELRNYYNMKIDVKDLKTIQYAIIKCDKNVQGVLAARYLNGKPLMVINQYNGTIIASMRVPDDLDFDAGSFLNQFNGKIDSLTGGGHEKAGGVTMHPDDFNSFLDMLEKF